ncbi:MAG: PAS domain-containing protein, partial [Sulfuricellaceae bacterium]|nr:PAS domain-containing protein [Sulfuricellaceae bacterium]
MSQPEGLVGQLKPEELEQAFALFSEASAQLTDAYHDLQQQVERLTGELAVANGELRRQYLEKEALSRRLSLLLSALPAGVVVLDRAQAVVEVNPAAAAMLAEPLLGEPWPAVATRCLRETGAPNEWELRAESRPGEVRLMNISSSHLDVVGGQILLLSDITDAYRMQQALERHQRLTAMGEMAARLAHQLRTPLATAMLYTAHLTKPALSEIDRQRFAEKSLARLRHLEQLIRDMLLFVRGQSGEQQVLDVSSLVAELRQIIEPQMAARGILFDVQDRSEEAGVLGNRKDLIGALLNVLENAMQACPEGGDGRIALAVEVDGDGLRLSVNDNGSGIADEVLDRLFEPFFTTRGEG